MAQQRMFRSLVAVASAVFGLTMNVSVAAGGPPARERAASVTFTSAAAGGEAVLVAKGQGITVEKRTTAERATIVLAGGGDRVTITLSPGAVQVTRGRRVQVVRADRATKEAFASVRAVLEGSAAVARAEQLRRSVAEATDAPPAMASALAFVSFLSGDGRSMRRIARSAPGRPGIQFARYQGAEFCWSEYSHTAYQFYEEREACIEENPWNPVRIYACNFEWTVKAEIAWFALLSCAGGLPMA